MDLPSDILFAVNQHAVVVEIVVVVHIIVEENLKNKNVFHPSGTLETVSSRVIVLYA